MRQLTRKRLTAWLLTLVMALSLLPAAALADEADDGLSPPAPQEDYGYVRLVFSEGEQLDLHHGEYITECSPTAEVFGNASEDFIIDGEYAALYYEGRLYHKAALDGVSTTRTRFSLRRTSRSYRWASLPRKRPFGRGAGGSDR